MFGTLQGRLPQELARAGIKEMEEANEYLKTFWPRFKRSVRHGAEGAEECVLATDAEAEGEVARDLLSQDEADGRQRQLRDLQGQETADSRATAPVSFCGA